MATLQRSSASHPARLVSRNKKAMAMGFFLLLSATIWFVDKLSETYQTDIGVPLYLVNSDVAIPIVGGERQTVRCIVRAKGYDIFFYKIFASRRIQVDVARYAEFAPLEAKQCLSVLSLQYLIMRTLGNDLELVYLQTDTLSYRVDVLASKKVPVRPNITTYCAPQYVQHGKAGFLPDSIFVSGAREDVDNVNVVETVPIVLTNVNSALDKKIPLAMPPVAHLALSDKYITYQANVIRFTEIQRDLPIVCQNLPDGVSIRLFPSSAVVSFCINVEQSRVFARASPQLVVDYNDAVRSVSGKLAVHIGELPDYVLLANVRQPFVQFVLVQNNG
jgi:hypothetical protein